MQQPNNLFVTGGASGIGKEFIRQYSQRHPGVNVAVFDLNLPDAVCDELQQLLGQGRVRFYAANVCDFATLRR